MTMPEDNRAALMDRSWLAVKQRRQIAISILSGDFELDIGGHATVKPRSTRR